MNILLIDTRSFVLNLQDIIGSKDTVTKATLDDNREVLASSYAIKYWLLVILFNNPESCGDCYRKVDRVIVVNLTISCGNDTNSDVTFYFNVNSLTGIDIRFKLIWYSILKNCMLIIPHPKALRFLHLPLLLASSKKNWTMSMCFRNYGCKVFSM